MFREKCLKMVGSARDRSLFPGRRRRRSILRETLQNYLSRPRADFVIHVASILGKCSLQHVVPLVLRRLALTALHRSFELECHPVNNVGGEAQVVAFQFPSLEELIEKRPFIVLALSVP